MLAGREPNQMGWYELAAKLARRKSVLDVGCGSANGLAVLRRTASIAEGQDIDPRLGSDGVRICELSEITSASYDVVVAIDVIEHVQNDRDFLGHIVRIARESLFLSTPNWVISRCRWPYHVREYTPLEFVRLLRPLGTVHLFKGRPDGYRRYPVKHASSYAVLNELRVRPLGGFATRVLNRMLPEKYSILNHTAAWVDLS